MRILRIVVVMVLMAVSPALAADVDGRWTGSVDTPNGPIEVGFNFKADGARLTGTTTGPDGGSLEIKNGKVEGDKISFVVDLDFGGMPLTLNYSGVVSAEQIAMTIDVMGMPFQFAVKKAK